MKPSIRMVVLSRRRTVIPTLWLDAADTSTLSISSNKISAWNDKSGNGYHVVQANATKQPGYNVVNGRPAILPAQSGSALFLANPVIIVPQPFTVAFVGEAAQGVTIQFLFDGVSERVAAWVNWPVGNDLSLWAGDAAGGGDGATGTFATNNPMLAIVEYNNIGKAWINGTAASRNASAGTNTLRGLTIGSNFSGGNLGFTRINEFRIIPGILTESVRHNCEGELAWKWNLINSLPSGHPYKNIQP